MLQNFASKIIVSRRNTLICVTCIPQIHLVSVLVWYSYKQHMSESVSDKVKLTKLQGTLHRAREIRL